MRVIAGKYRNRTLRVSDQIRPTTDRVRETLFNILQAEIEGAVFVDAFAGSGAVGIEAISRGASMVYFLETNRKSLRALEDNLAQFGEVDQWRIHAMDVMKGLEVVRREEPHVHILFFDPPYDFKHYSELITQSARVFPEATHILESSTRTNFYVPPEVELMKHREVGETLLSFYRTK